MGKKRTLFLCFLILCQLSFGQTKKYPTNYFSFPIKRDIALSGNFAEFRSNHFHSGVDLRIGERIGEGIYAPQEGEVVRIKIQAWGGGKNLYIRHPNGYTTVYMHIDRFAPKIEAFVRKYQYRNKTYEFDLTLNDKLFVEKGELIAFAGNTGSSGGPHLHYEIRNSITEKTINPMHFGFYVEDKIKPNIVSIVVSPDNKEVKKQFDTIEVSNKITLGIIAYDRSKNSTAKNGVYSYELYIDNITFWRMKIDEFSFSFTRYANACLDAYQYNKTGKKYITCQQLPNNKFSPFETYLNNGVIEIDSSEVKKVEYVLKDFNNNTTNFVFYIKGNGKRIMEVPKTKGKMLYWNKDNVIKEKDIEVFVPKGALYEDSPVYFSSFNKDGKTFYDIRGTKIPLHNNMTIKISVPQNIKQKNKLVITKNEGKKASSIGGKIEYEDIVAKTKNFGLFSLSLDTIAPKINVISNKEENSSIKLNIKQEKIKIKITDNLSGISSYNAYINSNWVLMEYDGKTSTLSYNVDTKELFQKENELKLVVLDEVRNKSELNIKVIMP
ncbi:MAG: M23 family metallopeptidase [Bacteroidales bacterium]|jgi:hypothetical protein|nr:M23 family metallopeptidase [Bacteroidales bacterium]